jgi:hypothetical protein
VRLKRPPADAVPVRVAVKSTPVPTAVRLKLSATAAVARNNKATMTRDLAFMLVPLKRSL